MSSRDKITAILRKADIGLDGARPTDIKILNENFFDRVLSGGTLAIGESFMDKWWDVEDLSEVVSRIHKYKLYKDLITFDGLLLLFRAVVRNLQSRTRAFMVGQQHYDLGNDLYQAMLDKRMVYTSAVWSGVDTLEAAQEQKLEMLCQKLGLNKGQKILDIGCGWGSFMNYAAEKYDVSCSGLTVSIGQTELGRKLCAGQPVEFIVQDYRDYTNPEKFDHVVSVEMIEAVGPKNLRAYFEKVYELLKPEGLFALQAIGSLNPRPVPNPWLDKYIFPNGILPSLPQLEKASRGLFRIEHLENIGPDYDLTLMEWWHRFDRAYPRLAAENPKYDERFYRMWKFYLQSCAGLFRSKECQDWQIVFSPIH